MQALWALAQVALQIMHWLVPPGGTKIDIGDRLAHNLRIFSSVLYLFPFIFLTPV